MTAFVGDFALDFRTSPVWVRNEELFAQGRDLEQARRRKRFNAVPYFETRHLARQALKDAVDKLPLGC